MIWTLLHLFLTVVIGVANGDASSEQLKTYAKSTSDPVGNLTTTTGVIVKYKRTSTLNKKIILNEYFMETMSHFVSERIPERVVHAKGTGAFGFFEVINDITDICKAKLFSEIGKKTPIAVRFSTSISESGGADSSREPRGFAVKYYTEDGNLDLMGLNVPLFAFNEPSLFFHLVHALKRNPATGLRDQNMMWDFLTLRPETISFFFYLFSDQGIPASYRNMNGFPVHTFQVVNNDDDIHFVRFHYIPDAGAEYLTTSEAATKAAFDPDFATRDLYNAIANGNYPTYTVAVQVLNITDIEKVSYSQFDISKELSQSIYPLRTVGRLVLDTNPTNHFAQIELMAFSPCNLVPGIVGSPGKSFEARCLSYRETQIHRLGINFNKILVNQPLNKTLTYMRDGLSPVYDNEGGAPVYYPNSFHGPQPSYEDVDEILDFHEVPTDSYKEASELYNQFSEDEKTRLVENMMSSLSTVTDDLLERVLTIFYMTDSDLAERVRKSLSSTTTSD